MSGIPPSVPSDIAGSSLQAGYQARNVAKERDADRAGQSNAARDTAKAIDEAGSIVDTEDSDTAVFADAEGTGSMGRSFEDELLEDELDQDGDDDVNGCPDEGDGDIHLDIQA